jgi:alkaline phosphatase
MRIKLKIETITLTVLILSLCFISTNNVPIKAPLPPNGTDLTIILMIGDGMGFEQVKIARYVEGGKITNLTMEDLDLELSVMTHNIYYGLTDSAAAGTAIATGQKTFNGRIAIGPDGSVLETILEIALDMGKTTGLVSTTSIQHATPASFMTHVLSRSNYDEITNQIVENSNVDVLLGGGTQYFSEEQKNSMINDGYSLVSNKTALSSLSSGKILGLFSDSHMPYEQERNLTQTPSLVDMTKKAIELLQQNSNGFFLMVEGGRIDHASHDNDKVNTVLEMIAFDLAVREAKKYVSSHDNSILIVTADHETGGPKMIGENLNSTIPSFGLTEEQNRTLRIARANQIDVSWSTGGHTMNHVPLYALGKAFENITNNLLIDNTDVFNIMNSFFHDEEILLENLQPIDIIPLYYFYILPITLTISLIYIVIRKIKQK